MVTSQISRRLFLQATTMGALMSLPNKIDLSSPVVSDIAQIDHTTLFQRQAPTTVGELQNILNNWHGPVCIAGGRFSMGGQTRFPHSLQIDTASFNQLVWLNQQEKTVRVQAGMTWRQLQDILDPLNLSVKVMQSYSNFSIGGSVSVNCHGRYVNEGSISNTVKALQLLTPNGELLELNRTQHPDLFMATMGGYGGLGVISEVELDIVQNSLIKRKVEHIALADYPLWFSENILKNPQAVLHNADLVPPSFDAPLGITWYHTDEPPTVSDRLTPKNLKHSKSQNLIFMATELPFANELRTHYEQKKTEHRVVWRNLEASLDAKSLEPRTRWMSTYLLQEYFVPVEAFSSFMKEMQKIIKAFGPQILNISIRHSKQDNHSLLAWAKQDVFCFVVYYKQRNFNGVDEKAKVWTQQLVDASLDHQGCHYLPYRLHATPAQVSRAYPRIDEYLEQKAKTDPSSQLRNMMIDKYFL